MGRGAKSVALLLGMLVALAGCPGPVSHEPPGLVTRNASLFALTLEDMPSAQFWVVDRAFDETRGVVGARSAYYTSLTKNSGLYVRVWIQVYPDVEAARGIYAGSLPIGKEGESADLGSESFYLSPAMNQGDVFFRSANVFVKIHAEGPVFEMPNKVALSAARAIERKIATQ